MAWGAEKEKITDTSSNDLILRVTLDRPVYRPGEAIVATVTVINTTDATITIRGLNKANVTFSYGVEGGPRKVQRDPVFSSKEAAEVKETGGEVVDLAPGESRSRTFMITRMSRDPGDYLFLASMDPFDRLQIEDRTGRLYSNTIHFQVYGPPLFQRDTQGLLDKEDAIGLAAARTPGDIILTDAILIEDEMGFIKWWINIDYHDSAGQAQKTAFLVDPYRGAVWSPAKPFGPEMKPSNARVTQRTATSENKRDQPSRGRQGTPRPLPLQPAPGPN